MERMHKEEIDRVEERMNIEREVKNLEADLLRMQEDLAAAERARRNAEEERDAMADESSSSSIQSLINEKRRLEARISELEDELVCAEQNAADLASKKKQRLALEHQNKVMKEKLSELEGQLARVNRKTERRSKELGLQVEDERKRADLYEDLAIGITLGSLCDYEVGGR